MTEDTRAAESQEETSSQDQASTEQGEAQRSEDTSQADASSQESQDDSSANADMVPKSEITKRNKENENLRKRLRAFEKKEEEERKQRLSETDALKETNTTLEQENESLKGQVKRWKFERSLNLPDADLAWGMLSDLGLEVEWSDDYAPANIDEIRKVLKREKPRIWGSGSANGGDRGQPPPPSGSSFVDGLFRQGRTGTRR